MNGHVGKFDFSLRRGYGSFCCYCKARKFANTGDSSWQIRLGWIILYLVKGN